MINAKRICYSIFMCVVFVICLIPLVGMIFGWGGKSTENRTLSGLPSFFNVTEDRTEFNQKFTSELSDYFSENFGFRQELVTYDSIIKKKVFMHSAEPNVIIGDKDWYYFNETTDDYTGSSALSDRGIYRLQSTLDILNEYSEQNNITMLFFTAPNKNSVYPSFMPINIPNLKKESNLDRLNKIMKGKDYYLNVKSILCEAVKSDNQRNYYLKNDSHWNNLGALLAFNSVEDNLNSRIDGFDYIRYPVQEEYTEFETTGDLTDMLYPTLKIKDVQYDLGIPVNFSSDQPLTNLMANEISTTCEGRYYNAICYRDSFCNALIGIMSNAFANVRYTRSFPYNMNTARDGKFNVAIVEIAERNLPTILNEAPVIDAMSTEAPKSSSFVAGSQSCTASDDGTNIIINGRLGDWTEIETTSDIYIELRSDDNKSYFYRAFPITKGDAYDDSGFSVSVSKYSLKNGDYKAYIHVGSHKKTEYVPLDIK